MGLPEVHDLPLDVLDDPVWRRSNHTRKGRDGCRVPVPWETTGRSYGFGSGGSWLPQPDGWGELSVQKQSGAEGSTLELYRSALRLRRELLQVDESLEWLDLGEDVIAFRRGPGVACVVNFGERHVGLPRGDVLVASEPIVGDSLPGNSACWLR